VSKNSPPQFGTPLGTQFGTPKTSSSAANYSDYGGAAAIVGVIGRGPSAFTLPSTAPAQQPIAQTPPLQQPNPPVESQTPNTIIPRQNIRPTTPPSIAELRPKTPGFAQPASQTPPPAAQHRWGLQAFCPVTLSQRRQWVPGDRRWGVEHQGRVYLFSSEAAKRKFLANPTYYAPVLSGNDPILLIEQRQAVDGLREHGVFYRDRVYMFSGEATLARFSQSPARYAALVAAMEAEANPGQ